MTTDTGNGIERAEDTAAMASKGGLAKLEIVFGISSAGHLVTDPHEKNTFYHPIGNGIRCVHGGEVKDTTLLQGHSDVVNCVAMSPDGTCLASSQLGKNNDKQGCAGIRLINLLPPDGKVFYRRFWRRATPVRLSWACRF